MVVGHWEFVGSGSGPLSSGISLITILVAGFENDWVFENSQYITFPANFHLHILGIMYKKLLIDFI